MRALRALGLYLLAVFIGGALLAPGLYFLAQSFAEPFSHLANSPFFLIKAFAKSFSHLANSPFHRFVNRSLLGVALLGLWPLLRALGINSCAAVGLLNPVPYWKRFVAGLALGFFSLAVVAAIALGSEARVIPDHVSRLPQRFLGIVLTAIVVAVLEEILFRGALFGALRKAFNWVAALAVSSMVYALVHFMASAQLTGPVTWYSGLELLPHMLRGFSNLHELIPGFFNLTLAGILLALAYQRTGNLYFSIGLHAGWIFWLKSYGLFTRQAPGPQSWFWGSSKLIDGWLALLVLISTLLLFLKLPFSRNSETSATVGKVPG